MKNPSINRTECENLTLQLVCVKHDTTWHKNTRIYIQPSQMCGISTFNFRHHTQQSTVWRFGGERATRRLQCLLDGIFPKHILSFTCQPRAKLHHPRALPTTLCLWISPNPSPRTSNICIMRMRPGSGTQGKVWLSLFVFSSPEQILFKRPAAATLHLRRSAAAAAAAAVSKRHKGS